MRLGTRVCRSASRMKLLGVAAAALVVMPAAVAAPAPADCPWAWSPVEQLNVPGPFLGYRSLIRVDDAGWATAAWSEMDADNTEHILVSRRPPGGSWQTPQQVASTYSSSDNDHSDLELAVGSSGHAILTWKRSSVQNRQPPRAAYFDPVAGWSKPQELPVQGRDSTAAGAAVDASGRGLVSWAVQGVVFARFYNPGEGWSAVTQFDDPRLYQAPSPHPVLNDQGDAAVGWVAGQPTVVRYDRAAGGWQPWTRLFEAGRVREMLTPELALTPSGDLFAVWAEQPKGDTRSRVFAAHYVAGQGWEPTARVSGYSYGGHQPAVTANPLGEALVAWRVNEFGPTVRVESARFVPGRGWGRPTRIRTDAFVDVNLPSILPSGELTVLSEQSYPDMDGAKFSKVNLYTMRPPSDQVEEDAVWDLGYRVDLGSSPAGRVAALGAVHESLWEPSKGVLRASVRERRCTADR